MKKITCLPTRLRKNQVIVQNHLSSLYILFHFQKKLEVNVWGMWSFILISFITENNRRTGFSYLGPMFTGNLQSRTLMS